MALALLIGAAGGYAFWWLHLPLPWMLGALVATLLAALARIPMRAPEAIRPPVVAVIGVLLGSGFTPSLISQAGEWVLSLLALGAYLAVAAAIAVPFYRRVAGFDPVTAYFAGMPGGLAEMMMLGRAMGGDDRKIILAHAARIVVTVAAIAIWFRLIEGRTVGANPGGTPLLAMAPLDIVLLAGAGIVGAFLGVRLRLPAPTLLGPMILSGLFHVTGLTVSAPPGGLVIAAQITLGTVMGCRFIGVAAGDVGRALMLSTGITLLMLGLALVFALMLHGLVGQSAAQVLLAFAPGGLTEMGVVALAIGADVAYVALHHVVRIVVVIAAAPIVARWMRPRGP